MRKAAPLVWMFCTPQQAKGVLHRNGIDSKLFTVAKNRLLAEDWYYGPHVYIIDNNSNKAARITIEGIDEFNVMISSGTGTALMASVIDQMPAIAEHVLVKSWD